MTTHTQLHDLAESQPRDAFGFSDYTAFVVTGGYQWPVDFPRSPFYSTHQPDRTPFPGPPGAPTELPFNKYDPFFRQVLGELRHLASLPLYPHRRVDVRLVVDLDSNANRAEPLLRPRDYREDIPPEARHERDGTLKHGEYRDEPTPGYDRYFASSKHVLEWYEDVSGHARRIKGQYEDATEAERNAHDPDFELPENAVLDDLSDGSGPDSAYGAATKKKKKKKGRKPRTTNKKTGTNNKTAKPAKTKKKGRGDEESEDCSEYLRDDCSEDDSSSD